jgi:hypothetical protein
MTRLELLLIAVWLPCVNVTVFAANRSVPSVSFEENKGQWPRSVLYATSAPGYRAFLTAEGLELSSSSLREVSQNVELHWLGSNLQPKVTAKDTLPYRANYFFGNNPEAWRTSVRNFGTVHYDNVYPGIGIAYHHHNNELEQDIDVDPGVDVAQFRMEIKGARDIGVGKNGQLELRTPDGTFVLAAPYIYQFDRSGKRVRVDGRYVVEDVSIISFRLGKYDRNARLVIDPVLSYSTYLPKINTKDNFSVNTGGATMSVNSKGVACVTDGISLYGYDAAGKPTFTVADTQSVAKVGGGSVFADEQGNCFLAGGGLAKFSSSGSLVYTAFFGGTTPANGGTFPVGVAADSIGMPMLSAPQVFRISHSRTPSRICFKEHKTHSF